MIRIRSLHTFCSKSRITSQGTGFDFKVYLNDEATQKNISFWHDLPLHLHENTFNAVFKDYMDLVRYHLQKYEMSKEVVGNPIVQDTRKSRYTGKRELRHYAMFPYFNYGFLPKTWESPYVREGTFTIIIKGDDDPIDVVELGTRRFHLGQQVPVRVLGIYCLVDQSETDWKVLCLNEEEAQEKNINTFEDIERREPGIQYIIKNWFKYIKLYDGKKANSFLYDESPHDTKRALEVINQTHHHWQELVGQRKSSGPNYSEKRNEFNIVL